MLKIFHFYQFKRANSTDNPPATFSPPPLITGFSPGLQRHYPRFTGSIAVITPYRAQLSTLRAAFRSVTQGGLNSASDPLSRVEFGTVDGFQGREADVVIFSCVRARGAGAREQSRDGGLELGASSGLSIQGKASLGFLNDVRCEALSCTYM